MIVGRRITLRAWEQADLDAFTRWFNDPEVGINVADPYPVLSREQEERLATEHASPYAYAIVLNDGQRLIGSGGLYGLDWRNRSASVEIYIGEKDCWNQGYGREALGMLLEIGFEGLGLNRIELRVLAFNQRGIRCYLAAGFREEARLRRKCYVKGQFVDDVVMAVLAEEYRARKAVQPG